MSKNNVTVKGLDKLVARIKQKADVELQNDVELWLEASGMDFLRETKDQVKAYQAVDTRRLINSFDKGNDGVIWKLNKGKLSLDVGTNVHYARYVNDGHKIKRGGKVIGYVEGKPYFDTATENFREQFKQTFKVKLKQWSKRGF